MADLYKELIEALEGFAKGMRRYWKDTYQEEPPDLSQVVEAEKLIEKARAEEYYSKELAALPIFDVSNSLPEAFGEWILMCCYEPNGIDGWIRWYDINFEGEKDEKIYTTKELFEQFKNFSEKWGGGNDC